MQKNKNLYKIILAAMFAALTFVATLVISVPSLLGGYTHIGDSFVLLSGFILGPVYGAAAAGIGAMLADVVLGYTSYAAGTFIIKALVAAVAALIYNFILKKKNITIAASVISGIGAEAIMVAGYFLYECVILRIGMSAAVNIPANLVQAIVGIIAAVFIIVPIKKLLKGRL